MESNTTPTTKGKTMTQHTYRETIHRFRIIKHDELPEEHKEAMRAEGIDPDTHWTIYASFAYEADAIHALAQIKARAAKWETYKIKDHGEAVEIDRPIW